MKTTILTRSLALTLLVFCTACPPFDPTPPRTKPSLSTSSIWKWTPMLP